MRKTDGWYAWDRQWFEVATYTKLHGKELIYYSEAEGVKIVENNYVLQEDEEWPDDGSDHSDNDDNDSDSDSDHNDASTTTPSDVSDTASDDDVYHNWAMQQLHRDDNDDIGPIPGQGTCVICNGNYTHYGNNPQPLAHHGKCCDDCNTRVVMARARSWVNQLNTDDSTNPHDPATHNLHSASPHDEEPPQPPIENNPTTSSRVH